jgi:hypothetical protein
MRKASAIVASSLLVAACAQQAGAPAPVQALAAGTLRCIPLNQIAGQRVERGGLIYELSGRGTYRNDLQGSCPSLDRANGSEIAQTEPHGADLCRNDTVRVYDPVEARATSPASFPRCRMGDFVPVTRR